MLPTLGQSAQGLAFLLCGMRIALLYALMGVLRPAKHGVVTALADIIFCVAALAQFLHTAYVVCDIQLQFFAFICTFAGFLLQFIVIYPIIIHIRIGVSSITKRLANKKAETQHHDEAP